ncbi:MAG: hypothetical protein KAU28_10155, partial [Phycisphaerae bacterium]|nr:hypothetical protein [Phycisphaerae bacterium]
MVLHFLRILFVIVVVAVTLSFAFDPEVYQGGAKFVTWYIMVPVILAFVLIMVDMFWKRKQLQTLSGLFFGVLSGLVIAFVLSLIVDLVVGIFPGPPPAQQPAALVPLAEYDSPESYRAAEGEYQTEMKAYNKYIAHVRTVQLTKLLLGAAAVFLCVSFVLQTKDVFRFVIPYVEFSKEAKGARPLLLDTSVIIDGRIADIADTRILESQLIVPRFVLTELQAIADSDEKLKRNRGRRGLDVLNRLQSNDKIDIQILDTFVPDVEKAGEVDTKLVALGQHLGARIVTNDYNLNKISQLHGVDVININDLANALKPVVLPGETMRVKIIKAGEEVGQGVGYLEDGTMIVVEQGRDYIGREIVIAVTSVLQTSAGR